MDNTNQTISQPTDGQNSTQIPVQPTTDQKVQYSTSGVIQKEREANSIDTSLPQEQIKSSYPEIELPPELAEVGVEKIPSELPQLSKEHHELGVRVSGESTPVLTQPTGIIKIMSKEEAEKNAKGNVTNSIVWLAISILRQIKKFAIRN